MVELEYGQTDGKKTEPRNPDTGYTASVEGQEIQLAAVFTDEFERQYEAAQDEKHGHCRSAVEEVVDKRPSTIGGIPFRNCSGMTK